MAVTRGANVLKFTANADAWVGRLYIMSIKFTGTGLTVGQLLTLLDTKGSLIADHYVTATSEDIPILDTGADLFLADGARISAAPSGTWEVAIVMR